MKKYLSQILPAAECTIVAADGNKIDDAGEIKNIPVTNLVFDSREVTKDSLFFALPGTHTDGNRFIANKKSVEFNHAVLDFLKMKH